MTKCLISCGANIAGPFGEPLETLKIVLEELRIRKIEVIGKSKFYSSLAFPNPQEPKYLNRCLEITVDFRADDVLTLLKQIEVKMGRREGTRWGSRSCDLDLLSFANQISPSSEVFNFWYKMPLEEQIIAKPNILLLPHPRLQDRAFVLKPLMEFAAEWTHPVLNASVKEMYHALSKEDQDSVKPI